LTTRPRRFGLDPCRRLVRDPRADIGARCLAASTGLVVRAAATGSTWLRHNLAVRTPGWVSVKRPNFPAEQTSGLSTGRTDQRDVVRSSAPTCSTYCCPTGRRRSTRKRQESPSPGEKGPGRAHASEQHCPWAATRQGVALTSRALICPRVPGSTCSRATKAAQLRGGGATCAAVRASWRVSFHHL